MTQSPAVSNAVHFDGDWLEAEADLIEAAVGEFENRRASTCDAAQWTAVCRRCSSADMFAVSRLGFPAVVSAPDAAGLAEKIRRL